MLHTQHQTAIQPWIPPCAMHVSVPAWKSTPTANSVPVIGMRASLLSFGSRATPRIPSWMEYIRNESTPKQQHTAIRRWTTTLEHSKPWNHERTDVYVGMINREMHRWALRSNEHISKTSILVIVLLAPVQQVFGKLTFAWHTVATQVVANGAGAATGVLRSGETELRAPAVVYLAWVSSWMLSTASTMHIIRSALCVWCVLRVICVPAHLSDRPCRTPSCEPRHSSCSSVSQHCVRLSW